MFTAKKKFIGFPFAHRQHTHAGHCQFIHGHNWNFTFVFACDILNKDNFVLDFDNLKWIKVWLEDMFDHTLVLNANDPHLSHLQDALAALAPEPSVGLSGFIGFAKIVVVPNGSCEGLAKFVFDYVHTTKKGEWAQEGRRVRLLSVCCSENDRNSATYAP